MRLVGVASACVLGLGSVAVLLSGVAGEFAPWIAAAGFVVSLVVAVVAALTGRVDPQTGLTPEHLAQDRMAEVRHAVLRREFEELKAAHARTEADLRAHAASGPPESQAAFARAEALEAERDAARGDAERLREEIRRLDSASKEAAANAARDAARIAELERVASERTDALVKAQHEHTRAEALGVNLAAAKSRAEELERRTAAIEEARDRLAADAKEARAARDLAAAARDAGLARVSALEKELATLRSQETRLRGELDAALASGAPQRTDTEASAAADALRAERDAALAAADAKATALESAQARAESAARDAAAANARATSSSVEASRLAAELAARTSEAASLRDAESRREASLVAEKASWQAARKELTDGLAGANARLAAADAEIARLAAELRTVAGELASLRDSRSQQTSAADAERTASAAAQQKLAAELAFANSRADSAKADVARLSSEVRRLDQDLAAQRSAAEAAVAQVARLEEAAKSHAQATAALRAKLAGPQVAPAATAAELDALKHRAEQAEEAVRIALRECGFDPKSGPLDASSLLSAIGPLTLYAFGEDTPGWRPLREDDTLVSAVLHLRRQADERLRQLQNAQTQIDRTRRSA